MMQQVFQHFKSDISKISLPEKFTFPFYYEPHELSKIAALELQNYLEHQTDFLHNFGLQNNQDGQEIGKMFGVLVCQNKKGELGYLWGFSGKLAESNHHKYFVPPVFDMLSQNSFFIAEEAVLNELNKKIEQLEQSDILLKAQKQLKLIKEQAAIELNEQKKRIKDLKIKRDKQRENFFNRSHSEQEILESKLSEESKNESILLKKMTKYWNFKIESYTLDLNFLTSEIELLKNKRKQKSNEVQHRLFASYSFLNKYKQSKSIGAIFENNPPAGAGECAAPKLLHYAFIKDLQPLAMAEFWWGKSPNSEIRKHKHFYPACQSKCKPILTHMLEGIPLEDNPLLKNPAKGKDIKLIFEDSHLLVICKPEEFLSVPGKNIQDSVYERIKLKYPEATGPLLVHRLDMSTSGLMLIAKNETIYKQLQAQFIQRTIKKRYVALLNGIVKLPRGTISLPLRVDLENRPYQLVCETYGKPCETYFEVIAIKNKKTRVHFYPITGRTHQLRVHAAHQLGLNCPIHGDDLYGTKADRLYLHAEELCFVHPLTKENLCFIEEAGF